MELGVLVKDYKNGDKDVLIEIIDVFKPIINKYKRNSYYEDMDSELTVFLISLLEKMPMKEDFFENDKYVFSYIFKSLKNKYIELWTLQ